jgi:hypothetical protein
MTRASLARVSCCRLGRPRTWRRRSADPAVDVRTGLVRAGHVVKEELAALAPTTENLGHRRHVRACAAVAGDACSGGCGSFGARCLSVGRLAVDTRCLISYLNTVVAHT